MMQITIIGGHGKVALLAAPLLVEAGHEVRSIIRNPDHADDVAALGATPVVADVESLDVAALTGLFEGSDAVVWSAGAGGGSPERTLAVDRDAAIRTVEAAQTAGATRYVMVSYFGAGPDHGVPDDSSFRAYADAKTDADAAIEASGLDWVILRPSGLTLDAPTGAVEVKQLDASVEPDTIARADVAALIAAVLERPALTKAIVEVNTGATPIGEALDALAR
ncbi:NAD(P)H-binding protein [Agrococcus jejuensis]|uniref:NAD(P)H-binding protein n=1 Tax=Agrococcus jejuensis TaxID=399736 RepID=UPI0011A35160|nr:NAD(P)H-binding protein [Agrococcus jejuensis]